MTKTTSTQSLSLVHSVGRNQNNRSQPRQQPRVLWTPSARDQPTLVSLVLGGMSGRRPPAIQRMNGHGIQPAHMAAAIQAALDVVQDMEGEEDPDTEQA